MKVLIADDHAIVRKGLKELLQTAFADLTCGEASNGQEALDKAAAEHWDLLVLDIVMPVLNGVAVLKSLKHRQPNLPVIMLSMLTHNAFVIESLKSGAAGFLGKPDGVDELVEAVRIVMAGGLYIRRQIRREAGPPEDAQLRQLWTSAQQREAIDAPARPDAGSAANSISGQS